MKYLAIMLAVLVLSACRTEEPVIDAQYLALNDCKYTGESFESTERIWIANGRTGHFEDRTQRHYIYVCSPGNQKRLSLVRLVIDKETI